VDDVSVRQGRRWASSPIARLIIKRILIGFVMLGAVSVAVFFFTQGLPGSAARSILGQNATRAQITQLQRQLGLRRPLVEQYWTWLTGLLRFKLGTSLTSHTSVASLIATRATGTASLVVLSAICVIPLALLLGTTAARRPGRLVDRIVSGAVHVVLGLPEFVLGILIIIVLATQFLHLFPPASTLNPEISIWDQKSLLILPVLTLVLTSLPYLTESVKTTMREELASEHVRWALLSGIPIRRVVWHHSLRNVISPSVQVSAMTFTYLVGGTVAVETVFSFPGLGSALVDAVANRDIPVVQGITMLFASIALGVYIVADIIGVLVTPRLRTKAR
jgi:peptide/nickel transport system permease protein